MKKEKSENFQNGYFVKNLNIRRKKTLCYKVIISVIIFGTLLYLIDFSLLNFSTQIDYYAKLIRRKHQGFIDDGEDPSSFDPNDYFVKTVGCKMAKFPIITKEIKKFFTPKNKLAKINCTPPALSESDENYMWINTDKAFLLKHYNVTNPSNLKCHYREFFRLTEDSVVYSNISIQFNHDEKVKINAEFIRVICGYERDNEIYLNFHAFLIEKPEVEDRIRKVKEPKDSPKFNFMLLGIDSVSKINFYRLMKKSYATLQKLEALEFYGFSKVADNTFPNLVPVLTGLTAEELSEACAPNNTFDKCRFIWKDFENKRSMFAEDSSW